jgi:hypothetical protein
MKYASWKVVWIALVGSLQTLTAQPVTKFAGEGSIERRWDWAVKEAVARGTNDYWIVYGIKRLMDEDSYLSSGSSIFGTMSTQHDLYDQLQRFDSTDDDIKHAAKHGLRRYNEHGRSIEKKLKDVAIIARRSNGIFTSIDVSNLELDFRFRNLLVYWLGVAEKEESLMLLVNLSSSFADPKQRKHWVRAIGLHQSPSVRAALTKVLESDEHPEVQAEAAEWLGEQNTNDILPVLEKTVIKATTDRLIEAGVNGISKVETDESTELLVKLAKNGKNSKVRKKAAFWLGQRATAKSDAALNDILENDIDVDVQRQALYAIAQNRDLNAVDRLIKVAQTHSKSSIRKQAIYLLSDKAEGDDRALDALIAFTKK